MPGRADFTPQRDETGVRGMMLHMATSKEGATGDYARAVSAEVRSQMGKKRISQVKLAQQAKLSQNYLSKRLQDKFPFTLDDIEHIAAALGLSFSELAVPPVSENNNHTKRTESR